VSLDQRYDFSQPTIGLAITQQDKLATSLGRDEAHVLIKLLSEADTDATIPADVEEEERAAAAEELQGLQSESLLQLEVPEKVNIDCDLQRGGSVTIEKKIEGDVRVKTANGDIHVQKLRGHSIELEACGIGNSVFSSDLLEAKDLSVRLPCPGRFRAKRIHSSNSQIELGDTSGYTAREGDIEKVFDEDDSGAICDISSFYVTGQSDVNVNCSEGETRQAVRIKSNHGHVTVHASAPIPSKVDVHMDERVPLVDMGGVNGSCEVFVNCIGDESENFLLTSTRIHFDSISPDSVSIVKASDGKIHATMDRKVETDVRMLSCSNTSEVDIEAMLLDRDDEDYAQLVGMLGDLDEQQSSTEAQDINVNTIAFTPAVDAPVLKNIKYLDGSIENRSNEPDSRFDRKLRGETGSVGKINLSGASNQALQHFQGGETNSTFVRPFVAIMGTGSIVLETLSWVGNIARRYGLDEKRNPDELGRTATRRGRSLLSHRQDD